MVAGHASRTVLLGHTDLLYSELVLGFNCIMQVKAFNIKLIFQYQGVKPSGHHLEISMPKHYDRRKIYHLARQRRTEEEEEEEDKENCILLIACSSKLTLWVAIKELEVILMRH
jgi:hypothetical protein